MATYYCTEASVRFYLRKAGVDESRISSDDMKQAIDDAGKVARVDLSTQIDFTTVNQIDGVPPTPDAINLLTLYKTCEFCLVIIHGAQRSVETITDVMYWMKKYKELLEAINEGSVKVTDANGESPDNGVSSFTNTKPLGGNDSPVFGDTKYGTFSPDGPDFYGNP